MDTNNAASSSPREQIVRKIFHHGLSIKSEDITTEYESLRTQIDRLKSERSLLLKDLQALRSKCNDLEIRGDKLAWERDALRAAAGHELQEARRLRYTLSIAKCLYPQVSKLSDILDRCASHEK